MSKTLPLSADEIGLILTALSCVHHPDIDALSKKLRDLHVEEDDRLALEVVGASVMTKQERLNDLEQLVARIDEYTVRPSLYRKRHEREIRGAVGIAKTLFWQDERM